MPAQKWTYHPEFFSGKNEIFAFEKASFSVGIDESDDK